MILWLFSNKLKTVTLRFVWSYRTNMLPHVWMCISAEQQFFFMITHFPFFPLLHSTILWFRWYCHWHVDADNKAPVLFFFTPSPTHNKSRICRKSPTDAALVIILPPYGASVHGPVSMGSVRVVSELWKPHLKVRCSAGKKEPKISFSSRETF